MEENILKKINTHISKEIYASILYKYFSHILDSSKVGLEGFSEKFKKQSEEEYDHADQIIQYLKEREEIYIPGPIDEIEEMDIIEDTYDLVLNILNKSLKLEKIVKRSFIELSKFDDISVTDFFSKWVRHQDTEIYQIELLINKVKYKEGLYIIDQNLI